MNKARDFLASCVIALFIYMFKQNTYKLVVWYYTPRLEKKYSGNNLEVKLYKINASWMKVIFFSTTCIFAQFALKTIPSHSEALSGVGNVEKTYVDFPFVSNSWQLKVYYILGLSYHLENTVSHLLRIP